MEIKMQRKHALAVIFSLLPWAADAQGLGGNPMVPSGSSSFPIVTVTSGQNNAPFILQNGNSSVTFPVPSFQPTVQNTIAFDILPKGTPGDFGGNGVAWMDICNKDIIANGAQAFNCTHLSSSAADGHGVVSTTSFNGASNADLGFEINGTSVLKVRATDLNIQLNKTYTVATLPACGAGTANEITVVTDASAPTYNGSLTGGGAIRVPVFCNGSAWTSH